MVHILYRIVVTTRIINLKMLTAVTPVSQYVMDIDLQTVNILWMSLSLPSSLMIQNINQIYTLTVTRNNTQPQIIQLYQLSYYVFTAPEGDPPCEVYNFCVTTTYVGATYTGSGCSVPSPVISRMLPSLPALYQVEVSLNYSLIKNESKVKLVVSFLMRNYSNYYSLFRFTIMT